MKKLSPQWFRRRAVLLMVIFALALGLGRLNAEPAAALHFQLSGTSSTGASAGPKQVAAESRGITLTSALQDDANAPMLLFPGARGRLAVSVHNPTSSPITVADLAVVVGDAAAGCPAANFALEGTNQSLTVPASSSGVVVVPARMLATAPDACKDANFPLSFSGTASGADADGGRAAVASFDGEKTEPLPLPAVTPLPAPAPAPAGAAVTAPAPAPAPSSAEPAPVPLQSSLGGPGKKAPGPGAKFRLGGVKYPASCKTVYFFFDHQRIGSATPKPSGVVDKGDLSVPGSAKTGTHHISASCSTSGKPVRAEMDVQIVEPAVHVSGLVTSIPSPSNVSFAPKDVGKSAGLMLFLVLVVAFSCELFNIVFEERYDDFKRWLHIPEKEEKEHSARRRGFTFVGLFSSGAVLFGLLDPTFGFNLTSVALFAGLWLALLVLTVSWWFPQMLYQRIRHRDWGVPEVLPGSLVLGAVTVLLSRIVHFQPGFLFGVLVTFNYREDIAEHLEGRMSAICSISMTAISVVAWLAWVPVAAAGGSSPSVALIILNNMLATIFLCGLESAVFAVFPLKFMEGNYIVSWSKMAWAAIFGLGVFLMIHILLRPGSGYVSDGVPSNMDMAICALSLLAVSLGLWTYFHFFGSDDEDEAEDGEESEAGQDDAEAESADAEHVLAPVFAGPRPDRFVGYGCEGAGGAPSNSNASSST